MPVNDSKHSGSCSLSCFLDLSAASAVAGVNADAARDGLTRGGHASSIKSRIAGTLGFVGHVFFVLTARL